MEVTSEDKRGFPPHLSPRFDLKHYHQYVVMAAEYRMCTLRV